MGIALPCAHHPVWPMPVPLVVDLPVEIAVPLHRPLSSEAASLRLEGSVDSFDPVARATELAATLPRQWCGIYKPFPNGLDQPVRLTLTDVQSHGQMLAVRGEMSLGSRNTSVQGNLNAKSDQLDLIPLADPLVEGLEPGGQFVGLQGLGLTGWQAPRLTNPGGRLKLDPSCGSEALPIRGLW